MKFVPLKSCQSLNFMLPKILYKINVLSALFGKSMWAAQLSHNIVSKTLELCLFISKMLMNWVVDNWLEKSHLRTWHLSNEMRKNGELAKQISGKRKFWEEGTVNANAFMWEHVWHAQKQKRRQWGWTRVSRRQSRGMRAEKSLRTCHMRPRSHQKVYGFSDQARCCKIGSPGSSLTALLPPAPSSMNLRNNAKDKIKEEVQKVGRGRQTGMLGLEGQQSRHLTILYPKEEGGPGPAFSDS